MRSRAFGLEHELALQFEPDDPNQIVPEDRSVADGLSRRIATSYDGQRYAESLWIPNGSRFYVDMCSFLELADAECVDPRDGVALAEANLRYAAAMGALNRGVFFAQEGKGKNAKRCMVSGRVRVYHTNQDGKTFNTRGTHENYQLFKDQLPDLPPFTIEIPEPPEGFPEEYVPHKVNGSLVYFGQKIIPYLVTRQIFAGNGGLRLLKDHGWQYVLSQRAHNINVVKNIGTTMDRTRGIVNLRDEAFSDHRFLRFHFIGGDANMSQYARYLKLGVTAMVASLVEHNMAPDIELDDPVRCLKGLMFDLSGKKYKLSLKDGRKMSALEIQLEYCKALHKLYASHPNPIYLDVLNEYTDTLLAIRENDAISLHDRFDHALKYRLLERRIIRRGTPLGNPESLLINLKYHEVGPDTLFSRLVEKGLHRTVVSEDEIQRFYGPTGTPPETRARARVEAINHYHGQGKYVDPGWSMINVFDRQPFSKDKDPNPHFSIYLGDPRDPMEVKIGRTYL